MDVVFSRNALKVLLLSKKNDLISHIVNYTQFFIVDQFGNYVVQYVIMLKDYQVNEFIAEEFLKMNFISIAKQKFSSNVIEKCFDNCNDITKYKIIKEITNPEIVFHLLFDNYGNYVLQKALAFAKDQYYHLLISYVYPYLEKLKHHYPFGNKLYIKLISLYPELMQLNMNNQNRQINSNFGINMIYNNINNNNSGTNSNVMVIDYKNMINNNYNNNTNLMNNTIDKDDKKYNQRNFNNKGKLQKI